MLKVFFISLTFLIVLALSAALFRGMSFELPPIEIFPDMDRQAKVKFQKPSTFFANEMGSRLPVAGTMPMGFTIPEKTAAEGYVAEFGFTHGDDYYNSGRFGDYFGDGMPEEIEVTPEFLARGRERYDINCAICHGAAGNGMGPVANFWPTPIGNFHDPRLRDRAQVPDGSIFHTITNGKGLMGPYGANITVRDRWAITAHLRVLQRAQWSDETNEVKALLNAAAKAGE